MVFSVSFAQYLYRHYRLDECLERFSYNNMKVIVAGTRTITSFIKVHQAILESGFEITELVSGTARGVDTLGEKYASVHNIPVKRFTPNWMKYSTFAGPKRNQEMANYADCLILVWDGKSKGSKDMLQKMKQAGKPVYEKIVG